MKELVTLALHGRSICRSQADLYRLPLHVETKKKRDETKRGSTEKAIHLCRREVKDMLHRESDEK